MLGGRPDLRHCCALVVVSYDSLIRGLAWCSAGNKLLALTYDNSNWLHDTKVVNYTLDGLETIAARVKQ